MGWLIKKSAGKLKLNSGSDTAIQHECMSL